MVWGSLADLNCPPDHPVLVTHWVRGQALHVGLCTHVSYSNSCTLTIIVQFRLLFDHNLIWHSEMLLYFYRALDPSVGPGGCGCF